MQEKGERKELTNSSKRAVKHNLPDQRQLWLQVIKCCEIVEMPLQRAGGDVELSYGQLIS